MFWKRLAIILRPYIYKIMSQFVSSLLFEYFTIKVMANKFKVCKITYKKRVITKQQREKNYTTSYTIQLEKYILGL
jgi:hypothetical protein